MKKTIFSSFLLAGLFLVSTTAYSQVKIKTQNQLMIKVKINQQNLPKIKQKLQPKNLKKNNIG